MDELKSMKVSKYNTLMRDVDIFYYSFDNDRVLDKHVRNLFCHILSKQEINLANQYKTSILIKKAIAGRALTKIILANYLSNISPKNIKLLKTQYGKPYLENMEVHFSISHCDTMFLIGVSKKFELGIDIEDIKNKDYSDIAKYVLSDKENSLYEKEKLENKENLFLSFWTRKEAFFKANGIGLPDNLNMLDTSYFLSKEIRANNNYRCFNISIDVNHIAHVVLIV